MSGNEESKNTEDGKSEDLSASPCSRFAMFEDLLEAIAMKHLYEGVKWEMKGHKRALFGWEVEVENEHGYSDLLTVSFEDVFLFLANAGREASRPE